MLETLDSIVRDTRKFLRDLERTSAKIRELDPADQHGILAMQEEVRRKTQASLDDYESQQRAVQRMSPAEYMASRQSSAH